MLNDPSLPGSKNTTTNLSMNIFLLLQMQQSTLVISLSWIQMPFDVKSLQCKFQDYCDNLPSEQRDEYFHQANIPAVHNHQIHIELHANIKKCRHRNIHVLQMYSYKSV